MSNQPESFKDTESQPDTNSETPSPSTSILQTSGHTGPGEGLRTENEELQQQNLVVAQSSTDLNDLLTSVDIPMLVLSSRMEIRAYTAPLRTLFNVRPQDIGRPISEITHNLAIRDLRPVVQRVLANLAVSELEVRDVEGRWRLMRVRPYRTRDNRIEGAVVILLDIDQLRGKQEELRAARDLALTVVEGMDLPVAVLHMDFSIRTVNTAFRRLPGWQADLEGRAFPNAAPAGWNPEELRAPLEAVRSDPERDSVEAEIHTAGPQARTYVIRGKCVRSDSDCVILLTLEETTERSAAEERLRSTTADLKHAQEELRALTARLFQAQENERRWVARELHDAVSQKLAIFGMEMEALHAKIADGRPEVAEQLARLCRQAATLQEEVRNLSHHLHPSVLDDLGLSPALRSLTEDFGLREQMLASYSSRGLHERLPLGTAAAFYRIAQEALHNVAKHAGKTHVKVTLEAEDDVVRLRVADLGVGFDAEDARGGLGLISMAERARTIGGSFHIESALGKGTTVTVDAPLRAHSSK